MRHCVPLFVTLLLLVPGLSYSQATTAPAAPATSLKGKFQDPTTRVAVSGVQIKLTNLADTSDVRRVTAKDDGSFELTGLAVHSYRLEATRLGYAPLVQIIRVTRKDQDAGVLALTPESVPVSGITVTESPAPAVQKGDTTEFRAGAVKTHRDATAEELVQKLPGVTMENGQIKAQGENVQNVLVNGRPFFGNDPTAAMRNLPAEVVDRIQVYDRQSDQAEFSGFDDGQAQKTMNFILRDRKLKFGKVYGGYGDQDRYQGGGNMTFLRGPTRLTLIGMSNNINQRNFSLQDLFGGLTGNPGGGGAGGPRMMMFGGGGNRGPGGGGGGQIFRMGGFGGGAFDPSSFLVGQQTGVSTTHSGGVNYVSQWGKDLSVSSSAFVNQTDNDNVQTLTRQYLPAQDSLAYYDQNMVADTRNRNGRFDARVEWTPDSLNSVILQPRLNFQSNDANSIGDAANTSVQGSPLSAAHSKSFDGTDGNNLSNRLTLRHRFSKRGRNISADINVGHILRDGTGAQRSLTDHYAGSGTSSDTLDQQSTSRTTTNSFSTRVAFTEPITAHLQAQAIYNPSLTRSESDARAHQLDLLTGEYTVPDSALSNSYQNRNTIQNGGLAMLYTKGVWRLLANTSYQHTRLHSEQTFPATQTIDRTFDDVLPSLTLSGTFANRRNLRLSWNTSTNNPSIGQLQNVVNNSNPLSLSTGNPDLRPTYIHSISLRMSEADPAKSKSRFLFMNVTRTSHPIANATFTAPTDTTIDGVFLARGTQLTRPVNLDQSWNANLFGVYSRPTKWIKSIVSFNGGGSFTRNPTQINGLTNVGSAYALRSGATLSSNISQNLDFTVSYQGTYNLSRNTLSTGNQGDYYSHSIGVRFNAVAKHGIVVRQELNHNLQSGVPSAYGQDIVLWNTTLGKKFLKGEKGELRVTASDVLEQNRSVSRSITETYVQDSRDRTLGRFVQAVFTYTFR
jgi:hypothetical protein